MIIFIKNKLRDENIAFIRVFQIAVDGFEGFPLLSGYFFCAMHQYFLPNPQRQAYASNKAVYEKITPLDSFNGRRADDYTYIYTNEGIRAVSSLILNSKY